VSVPGGRVAASERIGWTTMTSLLAFAVGEPASASASSSVILVPVIVILPGARTSPITYTNWLLY
jgi:hypothetical protein